MEWRGSPKPRFSPPLTSTLSLRYSTFIHNGSEPFLSTNMNVKNNKLTRYIQDAIIEMRKVTWPTKKQVTNYSLVVIAMSIGIALFFGVLDYVLNLGLEMII